MLQQFVTGFRMFKEMKVTAPRKLTMTGIADYLNNVYDCKSTGEKFTAQDVQGYIARGRIPREYGGGIRLELDKIALEFNKVKIYKLIK